MSGIWPGARGQGPGGAADASSWDFLTVRSHAEALQALGRPFLLGVSGVGTAEHLRRGEATVETTSDMSMGELIWNRRLELQVGSVLEGGQSRVHVLAVKRWTEVGGWELVPGDSVRLTRIATSDIEELIRQSRSWGLDGMLGFAFSRVPGEGDRLSLGAASYAAALADSAATPEVHVDFEVEGRRGRSTQVTLVVENRNSESTELSFVPGNYVDFECKRYLFSTNVELGSYYRFELYQSRRDGTIQRARKPGDALRPYIPILEGRRRFETDAVSVLGGTPRFEVTGRFQLTDGRIHEIGPLSLPPS